jgi:hypothetical protein
VLTADDLHLHVEYDLKSGGLGDCMLSIGSFMQIKPLDDAMNTARLYAAQKLLELVELVLKLQHSGFKVLVRLLCK